MLLAALLLAQTAASQCAAVDADLATPLAGWNARATELAIGTAAVLPTDAATKRAATRFVIAEAGNYGVALDQPGWIDVVPDRPGAEPLKSVRHGHGPECSTIRKIVRFELAAGAYRLELSGLEGDTAKVLLMDSE